MDMVESNKLVISDPLNGKAVQNLSTMGGLLNVDWFI